MLPGSCCSKTSLLCRHPKEAVQGWVGAATGATDPHFTLQCCPGVLAPVEYGTGNQSHCCSSWEEVGTDGRHSAFPARLYKAKIMSFKKMKNAAVKVQSVSSLFEDLCWGQVGAGAVCARV